MMLTVALLVAAVIIVAASAYVPNSPARARAAGLIVSCAGYALCVGGMLRVAAHFIR